jgi:hypothetical protein
VGVRGERTQVFDSQVSVSYHRGEECERFSRISEYVDTLITLQEHDEAYMLCGAEVYVDTLITRLGE